MATYIQSNTGAQLTDQQIRSGSFPPGTFFIEAGTGRQLSQQQIAGATPSSPAPSPAFSSSGGAVIPQAPVQNTAQPSPQTVTSNPNVALQTPGTMGGTQAPALPNAPVPQYDTALNNLLSNPTLTQDQKTAAKQLFDVIATNDQAQAARLASAFSAATQYSEPYFKAQAAIALDTLTRGIASQQGDLAFKSQQLQNTLDDLTKNTNAAKDYLSFTHQQELDNLARSYKGDLQATQDQMASLGFTSSTKRAQAEQLLADQNTGLVESSNKKFGFQNTNYDTQLNVGNRDYTQNLAYYQNLAQQNKTGLLRTAESTLGSNALSGAGYSGLLGGLGGTLPRQQATDALSFANGFTGSNSPYSFVF